MRNLAGSRKPRNTGGDTAVSRKERDFITLRFRKKLDDDLKEAIKNLEDGVLSSLVRDGLRLMLGIRTTKTLQVIECSLKIPGTHEIPNESPAQGNEPTNIDLQRTPLRESIQEPPTQLKEAAKFPQKPPAPYLNQKRRN